MTRFLSVVVIAAFLGTGSAVAHHSFSAYYFEEQSVSIEGELVEFDYTAPHAWVHVMAADGAGQLRRYAAEWANPTRLRRAGITQETLKAGDRVIITGSPGRNPAEYKIHLKRIERPADGWQWRSQRRRR